MNDDDDVAALRARVALLEQTLRARDTTIAVLVERVEQRQAGTSAFAVFEQNLDLERVVTQKTRELQEKSASLAEALAALRSTHAELLQAQKLQSIGQLAAGIAHEINTPMQFILDNTVFLRTSVTALLPALEAVQALVAAPSPQTAGVTAAALRRADVDYLVAEMPRALDDTREGIDRVRSIVTAMRNFAHRDVVERSPTDINDNLRTTMMVARSEWRSVADVRCELDDRLPLVPARRGELNQVFLNLLVNAAHAIADHVDDHARPPPQIVLRSRRDGDDVVIEIADSGGGIPVAIRDRIFDPFFTTKPVGKGTGQGLAIARNVVEKHDGSLTFADNDLGGTTFFVRLPLQLPHDTSAPVTP